MVLLLEEDENFNAKSILSLLFPVFISFDSCNSFPNNVLVCFLRA